MERFNRTLKNKMFKRFTFQMSYRWVNILDELLEEYNHSVHSKICMRPVDVTKRNEKMILKQHFQPTFIKNKNSKFEVNDQVRISKYKHIFEKGYTPNFSAEVFTIVEVLPTHPITYRLKDYQDNIIKGCFYKEEIIKTKCPLVFLVEKTVKKRKNKTLVKWFGFDESHNTWIDNSNKI